MSQTVPPAANENSARRLARLAAVQGLYRIALTQQTPKDVIKDFHDHPPEQDVGETLKGMDMELFGEIVTGVTQHADDIDELLKGALSAKISGDRMEVLLRAILRAGAYELHHHAKIPAAVLINDYVDVAHAFFDAKEPGLVNGVLDKLAKNLRS
jgi:transcription antitermination protein NusB